MFRRWMVVPLMLVSLAAVAAAFSCSNKDRPAGIDIESPGGSGGSTGGKGGSDGGASDAKTDGDTGGTAGGTGGTAGGTGGTAGGTGGTAGGTGGTAGGTGGTAGGTGGTAGGTGGTAGGTGGTAGGTAGTGGWPGTCPSVSTSPLCQNCVETLCNSQCVSCGGNLECKALHQCVLGCSGSTCISACEQQHPAGVAPLKALLGDNGCMATGCASACGGGQGGSGGATTCAIVIPSTPCRVCIEGSCLGQCQACAALPACLALIACSTNCATGDQACLQACKTANPDGITSFNAYFAPGGCAATKCGSSCTF